VDILLRSVRAISDPVRVRALGLVAWCNEVCVCEAQDVLSLSLSTASRALKQLEEAGWVENRREGRWVYYRLAAHLEEWQKQMIASISLLEVINADRARYNASRKDGNACAR